MRRAGVVLLFTLGAVRLTAAQELADPTLPPASLAAPAQGADAVAAPSGPLLQSILISTRQGGRQLAVIDGQTVRLGDKYKGAQLVRLTESEVVLQTGKKETILKLFPAPSQKPSAATGNTSNK